MSEHSEFLAERAEMARVNAFEEQLRPFYLLKPRVFPDGNAWIAMYGENIQEGVCGCGVTPFDAAADFDYNFFNQRAGGGQANARLIAAAPELLDGCNALLGLIQLVSANPNVPQFVKDILNSSHRKAEAEAAVAKAEGGAR